jgi:hypothetical protein
MKALELLVLLENLKNQSVDLATIEVLLEDNTEHLIEADGAYIDWNLRSLILSR